MRECYCEYNPFKNDADGNPYPESSVIRMDYIGDGKFKCPKCGLEEDHHDVVYKARIEYKRFDDDSGNEIHIIEPITDKRLLEKEKGWWGSMKDIIEDYLPECQDEFVHKHKVGVFDCDILIFDYRTSYESIEYETEYEMLKEVEVVNG